LKKVETGEMKSSFNEGCSKADVLAECIDRCGKLEQTFESMESQQNYQSAQTTLDTLKNLGCPFSDQRQLTVVAPDIIGKTPAEAQSLIQKHLLQVEFWENETPDVAEANRIYNQVPSAGAQLNPGDSVDASLYRHNPDAPPTRCVSLKEDYKRSVASTTPDFQVGKRIIDKASSLDCYWTEKGRNHLRESISRYEKVQKEAARVEKLCKELRIQYKEKIVTQSPDFDGGVKVLSQAEQCDWHDQAVSHFNKTIEAYNEHIVGRQKRCQDLAEQFDSAVQTANKSLDSSEVKAILASAKECSWYSNASQLIPCMDGQYNGWSAFNSGNLEDADKWARWGKSHRCAYSDKLLALVEEMKDSAVNQQRCKELSDRAIDAANRADQTLDSSELKSILSIAGDCEWTSNVINQLPCMDGEYNALRAYNSGELNSASAWTNWGRENNCAYVDRVSGLISQRVTQYQQQSVQQKPGFWETFGQNFAKEMEAYNQQMSAQMQVETQQYLNQAIQQQFQKKTTNQQAQQPVNIRSKPMKTTTITQTSQATSCVHIDSQLLAACKVRNVPLGESLYDQAAKKNCNLSSATIRCIDQYIDEWLNNIEFNLGTRDDWKVKKDMRVFK
jgi:hypothetical protein